MRTMSRWTRAGLLSLLALCLVAMLGAPKGCGDDPAEDDAAVTNETPPANEPAPDPAGERDPGDATGDAEGGEDAGKPAPVDAPGTEPEIARTWRSESCGARTYAREMVFLDGGTYVRVELVSPCPEGAMCVWSGILTYRGSWAFDGTAVALSGEQQVGATGGGDSFGPGPRKLIHQADPLMLFEPLASARCEYLPAQARDVTAELKMSVVE